MSFAKTIGFVVAAAVLAAPAGAQGTGWTTVGRTVVQPDAGSGSMDVRWEKAFREAMLCVDDHAIKLTEATFRFADGSSKAVKLRQTLADGACSKPLSVPRKSDVASVDIAYDSASLGGSKAKVQITAR